MTDKPKAAKGSSSVRPVSRRTRSPEVPGYDKKLDGPNRPST